MKTIELFVDASKTGVGLYCPQLSYKEAKKISCMLTTNEAEWTALLNALYFNVPTAPCAVIIKSDSKLVVETIKGAFKVNKNHVSYYTAALKQIKKLHALGYVYSVVWIPREENTVADELSQTYRVKKGRKK